MSAKAKLQPYPSYKDSGAEWLGEVPEHWACAAIKRLTPVLRGASPRPIDDPKYFDDFGEYAWVRISNVTDSKAGFLQETDQTLSKLGASLSVKLEPGDLFLSIAGSVGKPCITKIKACIHDGFVYFPRLNLPTSFLYSIFEVGTCFGGLGKFGTQLNLNTETVGGIIIPVPPADEINTITSFLDHETGKLDLLIAEQEGLVELLQEKRRAVISHAVTKGLDPTAPMKDSGVEWLGEVPEHWENRIIKYVTTVNDEVLREDTAEDFEIEYVEISDVNCIDGISGSQRMKFKNAPSRARRLVRDQDILVSTVRTYLRAIATVSNPPANLVASTGFAVIRPRRIKGGYLGYAFLSEWFIAKIISQSTGVSYPAISASDIVRIRIPIPPLEEQTQIAAFLDTETRKLDALVAEARRCISLLRERRGALISAAVTGKIDVRGWRAGT